MSEKEAIRIDKELFNQISIISDLTGKSKSEIIEKTLSMELESTMNDFNTFFSIFFPNHKPIEVFTSIVKNMKRSE